MQHQDISRIIEQAEQQRAEHIGDDAVQLKASVSVQAPNGQRAS